MSGRGKSQKSLDLIEAASRILEEIQPASVRAVCYRLFTEKLLCSMDKANTNGVSRQLVYAREQGLIPWSWVVDETREAERISSWRDPDNFIKNVIPQYRKDYWRDQPVRIEAMSEKGTIRGMLQPVLDEFGVTFRVMHGHGSATAIHALADDSWCSEKPLVVLYCGDHDPSGMHMSEIDLPERIVRYGGVIELVRVAIREEDTKPEAGVPFFSVYDKVKDPRYQWFRENYGERCFELDALSPVILRERVRAEIEARLDLDAWNHDVKVEAAEVESMTTFLKSWRGISGLAHKYGAAAAGQPGASSRQVAGGRDGGDE